MTLKLFLLLLIEVVCLWGLLAYVVGAVRSGIRSLLWQSISFVGLASAGIIYYGQLASYMVALLVIISTLWYALLDRRVTRDLSQRGIRHSQLLRFRTP